MQRIGLALSGGGFRATLFHLGLVRFLRDAHILPHVTHITSVSGGSIIGAHLVLNWDRYNGSSQEFDEAAAQILDFVRLDVRNRVVRRYPLAIPARWTLRRFRGGGRRRLTRTGLLEVQYEKYLYGDISLFELPEKPELHTLATNVGEGCLCSFTRKGLIMQRRLPGRRFQFDHIHTPLATVAMAVTASSAFPGFFHPLELSSAEIGAQEGEFTRQAFTDGGVFDNLGVRMFRWLEREGIGRPTFLSPEDFFNLDAVLKVLSAARDSEGDTPTHRLAKLLARRGPKPLPGSADSPRPEAAERVVARLDDVVANGELYREPAFDTLQLEDAEAQTLLHLARTPGRKLDLTDRAWLNRQLLEAALREATGGPCLRPFRGLFDAVLVSDAGKPFRVRQAARPSGLVRTAMRSSDILMDRVGQLEREIFADGTSGFVPVSITQIVPPSEDDTAVEPEVQRQIPTIRTDLDRFSNLEISHLVQHGYCIARKACRAHPGLFGEDVPRDAPWDPTRPSKGSDVPRRRPVGSFKRQTNKPSDVTANARSLQASGLRRVWGRLFDYRDWVSYVYVPLIVPILVLLPYFGIKYYKQAQVVSRLLESVRVSAPSLAVVTDLLQHGPVEPWVPMEYKEVSQLEAPDYSGFDILTAWQTVDLRAWYSDGSNSQRRTYTHRAIRVRRSEQNPGRFFRLQLPAESSKIDFRSPNERLRPVIHLWKDPSASDGKAYVWELVFDFSRVPPGKVIRVITEELNYEGFQERTEDEEWLRFRIRFSIGFAGLNVLLPKDKPYGTFEVVQYPPEKPEAVRAVQPDNFYPSPDNSRISFQILRPKVGQIYEVRWTWRDQATS